MRTDEIRARLDAATPVTLYPEMDAKIVGILRAGENPSCLYAAALIEHIWAECDRKDAENAVLRKALEMACNDAASGGSWHPETVTAESLMGYYLREASAKGGRP